MLTQNDKINILKQFPNIKLSYENITHKKVYNSDYIIAIPEGIKCFAWFTNLNDKMVCLIMKLTNNKQITDIRIMNACFSNELAFGTILYGTLVERKNNYFYYIEEIFSYRGEILERICWGEKLVKINNMFKKDLRQVSYNNSFIVFGIPYMYKTNEEFENNLKNINYNIDNIQFKLFDDVNKFLFMHYKNYIENKDNSLESNKYNRELIISHSIKKEKEEIKREKEEIKQERTVIKKQIVFLIRPDIQDDIYYLYCLNKELKEVKCGIAHIPDYKTSVMMNKLFRIIKENNNLDALEESDDEEEFENQNEDKFVHLNKSYKMICKFNHKFKKWIPFKLANENMKILMSHELTEIYKVYDQNKKRQHTIYK
jgi:hypothetical protein